ncbi:hypothetical protein GCM10009579_34160 [Streptomyces javensis]|uniref:Uncharacterized protein n=1 Tax=Streptomyces javensis TaxID=114698 RepID=A0ABP4HL76_9ACTN
MQGRQLVLGEVRRDIQLLDRDLAAQQFVLRAPHRAHATTADLLGQAVTSGYQVAYVRHRFPLPAHVRCDTIAAVTLGEISGKT